MLSKRKRQILDVDYGGVPQATLLDFLGGTPCGALRVLRVNALLITLLGCQFLYGNPADTWILERAIVSISADPAPLHLRRSILQYIVEFLVP